MNYFVIAQDGQKYGPADISTLNQWVIDARIIPTTMLEDAASGQRVQADQLPGLTFSSNPQPGYSQPNNSYAQYPRGGGYGPITPRVDDGSKEFQLSWIFSIVGFLAGPCLCFGSMAFSIVAIVLGAQANKKGHPKGSLAIGLGIASLVLGPALMFAASFVMGSTSPR
jgi:hypothetical protein